MGQWTDETAAATLFPHLNPDQVADLVKDAEAEVKRYLRRDVLARDTIAAEPHRGDGGPYLVLRERPVASVELVETDWGATDAADFEIDAGAGLLERTRGVWAECRHRVSYTAGYEADAIPRWLSRATLLVMERLASGGGGAREVKSYRLRDYQVEFRPSAEDGGAIPADAVRLLEPHRNPVLE